MTGAVVACGFLAAIHGRFEMRATLGQLVTEYGDGFLLSADDLTAFVNRRMR